jgi:8-oxo-dGTP pyrophosphatase MutT (NUDIX family)
MQRVGGEEVWRGRFFSVRRDEFRYADGETAQRELVTHPGAVAVIAHDGERLYMVRQPREAVGKEALLELPAGKLDEEGETPLDTARRELVEEIGKRAAEWEEVKRFYTSPGFSSEEVILFVATDLTDTDPDPGEGERIEIEAVELDDLDAVIERCHDAKSLVGLLLFRERRRAAT